MENPVASPHVYRFEAFSLDSRTGELSHRGARTPLREQPLQLLVALLEHPGELVTREQLIRRLWPAGTFVDFDRGLNKAINHLREALGDSAEHPHFIETFPRRGYRFIVPVTHDGHALEEAVPQSALAARGFPSGLSCWLPHSRAWESSLRVSSPPDIGWQLDGNLHLKSLRLP